MLKGWCKVGKTTRTPELRAAELSTGLPGRLEVYLECATNDVHEAERLAHEVLGRYRHSPRDEWFKIDARRATQIIRKELSVRAIRTREQRKTLETFIGLVIIIVVLVAVFA